MTRTGLRPEALAPGTVVSVPVGPVRHWGIVTDQWGADGRPTVISNSRRRGGVFEEAWSAFAQGADFRVEPLKPALPAWDVLARARAKLRKQWSLVWNCEHFVRGALGLEVKSPQLRVAATVAVAIIAFGGLGGLAKSGSAAVL